MGFKASAEILTVPCEFSLRGQDAPLCDVADRGLQCFGKNDGIPLNAINAVLPDGSGGFWLAGYDGPRPLGAAVVCPMYPVNAFVSSLARTPDGTLGWGCSRTDQAWAFNGSPAVF